MKIQHKSSIGGYKFRRFKGSLKDISLDIKAAPEVTIPLQQGFSLEVPAIVNPGDRVYAGQVIGRADDILSSPIHSSVSGIVKEIKSINFHNKNINTIVITVDGNNDWRPLNGHTANYESLSSEAIQTLLYNSGITSADNAGIPTMFKTSVVTPDKISDVIVHGISVEPYSVSADYILEGDNKDKFVDGIKILKKVMPEANFHLALDKKDNILIDAFKESLDSCKWVDMYTLDAKYPQDSDEVLIPTILGKKYPYGYSAANMGVVCFTIQTILGVYDAVTLGKPVIDRLVGLSGTGWTDNGYARIKIGTPILDICEQYLKDDTEYRLVANSLMTENFCETNLTPIVKSDNMIIAIPEDREREMFSFVRLGLDRESYSRTFLSHLFPKKERACNTNIHGEPRPCISCGFCDEVCPVDIIPHLLYKHVERDMIDERVVNLGIYNCIDCNLCNYVCPSKIDLSGGIKIGKEKLIEDGSTLETCVLPYFDLTGVKEYMVYKDIK